MSAKRSYVRPTLLRREALSAITADSVPISAVRVTPA